MEAGEQSGVRARAAPTQPKQKDIDQHEAEGHTNYRTWCWACVCGRGRSDPHHAGSGQPEEVPKISFDYAYMAKRNEEASPILISVVNVTGRATAHVLPAKGIEEPYNIDVFAKCLLGAGHTKMEVQSDNEPAMIALRDRGMALARERYSLDLTPLDSIEYDHMSNGAVEVTVREVKAQSRVMKIPLEAKYGELPVSHMVLAWLVSSAAAMITRCRFGRDGKSLDADEAPEVRESVTLLRRVHLVDAHPESGDRRLSVGRTICGRSFLGPGGT